MTSFTREPRAYLGDDRKEKDQGVVTTEGYGVVSHSGITSKSTDKFDAPTDSTAHDIEVGDTVYIYGASTDAINIPQPVPKVGLSLSQYKPGLPYVFASLAGAPRGLPFHPFGVALTRFSHTDVTTHLMSIAIEGTFPVRNTGFHPIKRYDIVAARSYRKTETPHQFDGMPRGKLLPCVFSLCSVLSTSRYQCVSADFKEHNDKWIKEIRDSGNVDDELANVAHIYAALPDLGRTIRVLNDATAETHKDSSYKLDGNALVDAYALDTWSMIVRVGAEEVGRFIKYANGLALYIFEWIATHKDNIKFPEVTVSMAKPNVFLMAQINGLLISRSAYFAAQSKLQRKYTILGLAMSDAKPREDVQVYFNKSVG